MNAGRLSREQGRSARGARFAIAVSRFNETVTEKLVRGAVECLKQHKVKENDLEIFSCPGAFELPQLANVLCASGRWDAVICLGAVIRGETPHFEYVASASARGIQDVALRRMVPVTFGVLTTDTLQQALDRAGGKAGNKGWDAALAAIEMAALFRQRISRRRSVPKKRHRAG